MVLATRMGEGPTPARIMLVGEYWGDEEASRQAPFQGFSGQELNRMLHEAGVMRSECYCTNVFNSQPREGESATWIVTKKKDLKSHHVSLHDKFVLPILLEAYGRLKTEIALVQPNIIVALGATALWLLTGKWGILKWRGSQLTAIGLGIKVIPTVNPAAVLREFSLRPISVLDLKRAAAERDTKEYRNAPDWNFTLRPSAGDVLRRLEDLIARCTLAPQWIDFDLETRAGHITCAGLSWSRTEAICIPFMLRASPFHYWNEEEEAAVLFSLYRLLTHKNCWVRGQNLLYDCQYTWRHWHFVPNVKQDTMISHHSCFSGLRKSLDFQASMYCDYYVQWKPDKVAWKEGG